MSDGPLPSALDPTENPRQIWVGSIVIDCTNVGEMVRFWSEALHYVPRDPVSPDGVVLKDPKGEGPNVNLSRSGEGPAREYRLHLDLYVTDPLHEAERLQSLGATMSFPAAPGRDFITLLDPDGNPFCLIDIDWPRRRSRWDDDWRFGIRDGAGRTARLAPNAPGPETGSVLAD